MSAFDMELAEELADGMRGYSPGEIGAGYQAALDEIRRLRGIIARVQEEVDSIDGLTREYLNEDMVSALRLCHRGLSAALLG